MTRFTLTIDDDLTEEVRCCLCDAVSRTVAEHFTLKSDGSYYISGSRMPTGWSRLLLSRIHEARYSELHACICDRCLGPIFERHDARSAFREAR